jgi:hypothetical protein
MACGSKEAGGIYRPRHPQQSPFYRWVERFFPEFEAIYAERYQERYGFWRPIIGTVVRKFLECGDLKHGFARVRCPKCREEFLVPYSCRGRCFCPSCHQKRALEKAGWVAEHVCAEVPHRQFVFTIPKRLRIYFRFDRRLLGQLCRAAARTVITVYRAVSGRPDTEPGDEELLAGPSRNFQVYEADPLCCPGCGAELKIIAFIERHQTEVIEKNLRHCGLWEESSARGPPAMAGPVKD